MKQKVNVQDSEAASARIAAAEQILEEYGHEILHCRHVRDLALSLFDQLQKLHRLGPDERDILNAAALLHDIGWSISGEKHHKHSYRLIREHEVELTGFTPAQVELIANVARYHRKSPPALDHKPFASLTNREQQIVLRLAGLLRLADGLDRPHLALVKELRCEIGERSVLVSVRALAEPGLHIEGASRKRALFESANGLPVEFAAA